MARGVNKVILIGNLGDEPLCRQTHGGCSVTNISMVTNEVRRSIETGETTEYAEWHRVVMWGKLADIAKQYLHKGSQIYIEGKLRTRSFMDKQGQKRSVTEVVADEMQMLGTRPNSGMNSNLPQGNPYRSNSVQNHGGYNNGAGAGNGYGNSGQGSYQNQNNMGMGGVQGNNNIYRQNQNQSQGIYGNNPSMEEPMMDEGMMDMNDDIGNSMDAPSENGKAEDGKIKEPSINKMDDDIPF